MASIIQMTQMSSMLLPFHCFTAIFFLTANYANWLWSKLLQKELETSLTFGMEQECEKDNFKAGPSGMSRNQAYSIPSKWGGRDCLIPVDVQVIREIKRAIGGDSILEFTSMKFSEKAQEAYNSFGTSRTYIYECMGCIGAMKQRLFN